MNGWEFANTAAWAVSAVLILWMVWDAIKVGREHSEDLLQSSREGLDELVDESGKSGRRG